MRVAVTGANGLLGRAIATTLEQAGHLVVRLGRTVKPGVTVTDLSNASSIEAAIRDADCVIHAAGKTGDQDDGDVNVQLARTLGQAVSNTCAVINLSSVAVYGRVRRRVVTERTPCQPVGDYGRSKWRSEQALDTYTSPLCHLRIANIYDADKIAALVSSQRQQLIKANEVTNFVLVDDVAELTSHLVSTHLGKLPPIINVVRPDIGSIRYRQLLPRSGPLGMAQRGVPAQTPHAIRVVRRLPSLPNRTFTSEVVDQLGFSYRPIGETGHRIGADSSMLDTAASRHAAGC